MKIVYFYQYYCTSKGSWGTRVYEFTRYWAERGVDVTVVTSVYAKSDLKAKKLLETQMIDGVRVKIINVLIDNKQAIHKRIYSFLVYSFFSSWYALTLKADVVVASSGPLTVGIPGLLAKWFRRKKMVFEVRDMWPDGAIQLGVLKNKFLIKGSYFLEKLCYKYADLIVTLSPGMSEEIETRFGYRKQISITNSANIPLFSTPREERTPCSDLCYALYSGNIGAVNNIEWMFQTAMGLKKRGREDIKIVLIGEGQLKEEYMRRAEEEKLDNFLFFPLVPKTELVAYVQQALICLAPLKDIPVLSTSSPNKFFEALAAGIPVVQNTRGWMSEFLQEHDCGFTIAADDSEALVQLLIEAADQPEILAEKRINASRIAKQEFDKDILATRFLDGINTISEKK